MNRNLSNGKKMKKSYSQRFRNEGLIKKKEIDNLINKIFEYKKKNLKQGKPLIHESKEKNRKENLILSLRNEKKYLQNLNQQLNIYLNIITQRKEKSYYNYHQVNSLYQNNKKPVDELETIMNQFKDKLVFLKTDQNILINDFEKKLNEKQNLKKELGNKIKKLNNDIDKMYIRINDLKKTKSELYKKMGEEQSKFIDEKTLRNKIKQLEDLCIKLTIKNNPNSRNQTLSNLILQSENTEIQLKELEIKNKILQNQYKILKEKINNKIVEEENIKTLIQLKKDSNYKKYYELLEQLEMKSEIKKTYGSQSMTSLLTNNFSM